jgi:hypothetical protein
MEFTIYRSDHLQNERNCLYPHKIVVTNKDNFKQAVSRDYVCAEYKDGRRSNSNFICADCLPIDIDNSHSDNPDDWITVEDVKQTFPDIPFAVHYSRNHNKEKNGKAARPKFHVIFPIDTVTDKDEYCLLKRKINIIFPYCDVAALDASRFFFGTIQPTVDFIEGNGSLTELLKEVEIDTAKSEEHTGTTTTTITKYNSRGYDWFEADIEKYGIPVTGEVEIKGDKKYYYLKNCLFNPEHTDGKAAIVREYSNFTGDFTGQVKYYCYHNSCQGHTWKDVRELFGIPHRSFTTPLTYTDFIKYCKVDGIDISWNVITRQLAFYGDIFDIVKDEATLVRTAPQILKSVLKKANFSDCTSENIKEDIIVYAASNAINEPKSFLKSVEYENTHELDKLCKILQLSESDKYIFTQWVKQCYCMAFNDDSQRPAALDFGLVIDNPIFDEVMHRLIIFDDFLTTCVTPHTDTAFSAKSLTTSWVCKLDSIPQKRYDWVTSICASPIINDTMPYDDEVIYFPHRTSYYTYDENLLKISGFWQGLHIPNDLSLMTTQELDNVDYTAVWSEVKQLVKSDFDNRKSLSSCYRLNRSLITQTEFNTTADTDSEVAKVLNKIIDSYGDGLPQYKEMTVNEFKTEHGLTLPNSNIGKSLKELGYKVNVKRVDGKVKRVYNLPIISK